MTLSPRFALCLLLGGLLLTGCRTYGNEGYDSQTKAYDAIQNTVQQLEQDLGRAQSDLRQLESAADTVESLMPLAERYRSLVMSHEATLDSYQMDANRLSGESSYRTLHRTYGALITDRRLLQRQYARTIQSVWVTVRDTVPPAAPLRRHITYTTTPVQFPRERPSRAPSMTDALQGVEETPGLQGQEAQSDELG